MRPHQRHCRARELAEVKLPLGEVIRIPNLLRKQAVVGKRLHGLQQVFSTFQVAGSDFVVRSLARQQRPEATYPRTIVGTSILMFAVAVVVVAVPAGPRGCFHFQLRVDDFDGVQNARIIGGAQAKANQRQSIHRHEFGSQNFGLSVGEVF